MTNLQIQIHGEYPQALPKNERAKVADFYAARDRTVQPLPWPSIAPPFTYSTVGLPTFKISRMRRDEDGIDEGDYVVDGAAFSKNGNLTLVGYDLDIGNMRSLFLLPMDGDARAYKGVVSGYDTVGPPTFSSKVFVERIPDNRRYDDIRDHTGFFNDIEAAAAAIETVIGPDNSLQKRLSTLAVNGYLGVAASA